MIKILMSICVASILAFSGNCFADGQWYGIATVNGVHVMGRLIVVDTDAEINYCPLAGRIEFYLDDHGGKEMYAMILLAKEMGNGISFFADGATCGEETGHLITYTGLP